MSLMFLACRLHYVVQCFPNYATESLQEKFPVQTLLSSRLLSQNLKNKIHKTIILPVVLYGCEAWSLTSREERRLRVFENTVLRQIFVPKRDVNGECKRLHNEELHSFYHSPNIGRMIKCRRLRWAGHVARMEEGRSVSKILTGTQDDRCGSLGSCKPQI